MVPIVATLSEWHIILALIIVFLLFGGRKLPELARGVGEAIKEFKKAQRDLGAEVTARPPLLTPTIAPNKETPTPATVDAGLQDQKPQA